MISAALDPAVQAVLSEVLAVYAPHSTLLAQVGEQVWEVRPGGRTEQVPELSPPVAWLESGEMAWLTQDGALLGLLWTEADAVPEPRLLERSVQMLTLVLASAQRGRAHREVEVMVTQLPIPTAWLSADLHFRKVSRPFLELFGLSDAQVEGRAMPEVFGAWPSWWPALEAAASGRALALPDERVAGVNSAEGPDDARWVRGEARPYFGGGAAGVLVSWQDVSQEYRRAAQVTALLDSAVPAAVLTPAGAVVQASRGLLELCEATPEPSGGRLGQPLWDWPCFTPVGAQAVRQLVRLAAQGGDGASGAAELVSGAPLTLALRRSADGEALVAQASGSSWDSRTPLGMLGQVLSLTEDATILLDHGGRAQLVSDRAAAMLGVEPSRLVGLALTRVLAELGVKAFTPQGEPLPLLDWRALRLPWRRELLLALPDGTLRQVELRASSVGDGHAARPDALLSLRDLTALRRTQAKLRHDSRHDSLTGLLNRLGLREALQTQPALSARGSVVACLALDGLEGLQAALGRTGSDRLMLQLAARLNDFVTPQGGRAGRLADDQFAVVLPAQATQTVADALRALLREPFRVGPREVPLGAALGLAVVQLAQSDAALADAELAVQHARRREAPQVSVFESAMRTQVASAFELEDALRGAVAGEQFALLYQPALHLGSGQILGAEALLRWRHPTLGTLAPGQFLPLAARSDLIAHVSEWVVQTALRARTALRRARPGLASPWQVSVNLSLDELRRSGGLSRLLPLMTAEGAPDIEVAAHSLLDHGQETLGVLEPLRALGARISVDDFGEGASSLSALTRFPLSAVKLHPNLIARLPGDARSVALVEGTVDLAHRLGLEVVAVGVETRAQLDLLASLGCDAAQGYAISPPLELPELLRWVKEH